MISGKQPWVYLEKLNLVCSFNTDTNFTIYLEIDLIQQNGTIAISSERFLKESLAKTEGKSGSLKKENTPMESCTNLEIYDSSFISVYDHSRCRSLVGMSLWDALPC